ncbi:MAG TPA: ABC transporter permease subunit [Acetobacteraceae bacterium]|jgi:NitT/TauT family transport system permease protein|nr:ABC transporter permease subunit [Acetobacteraceae bacterium]
MTRVLPVLCVLAVVITVWFAASVPMNWSQAAALADDNASWADIAAATQSLERPLLPTPAQIAGNMVTTLFFYPITAPRSLLHHALVTAWESLFGFVISLGAGIALAIGIVHIRTLDRTLMPWLVASQAIPVLAIAPMVVVVLGNIGLTGALPKALIAGWLSFFPITTGMVKGLRSSDVMQRDLLHTYNATVSQIFTKLRWPSSMAFLFPAMKVAAPLALVGAIVAELPTGAQAGLGARLLTGSYYGLTLQIWSALLMAALLAVLAIGLVDVAQAVLVRGRGGRL